MLVRYAQYKGVGYLDICEEGDAIMADKGFITSDVCTPRGVSLIIPPFKKGLRTSGFLLGLCQSPWLHRRQTSPH